MEGAPVHVAFTAATLTGNHGAEAMLLASMGELRRRIPGARFHVFSYALRADREAADPSVRVWSLTPAAVVLRLVPLALLLALLRRGGAGRAERLFPADLRALAGCRMVLDLAGVAFADGRLRFLPYNVLTLVPAFLLGIPVVKASQALGPFDSALNRRAALAVLRRCAAVFARGERTLAHVTALLGAGGPVRRAADVAFLLDAEHRTFLSAERRRAAAEPVDAALAEIAARRAGAAARPAQGGRVVGVCPSSLLAARDGAAYLDLMAETAAALVARGDVVVLFPHATRGHAAAGPRNNDLWAIARLLERIPGEARRGVVAVEGDVDALCLQRLLAALDLAVVSRFHAMVGMLALAKPPVVVGWGHKYMEVMEGFGLGGLVLAAEEATSTKVLAALEPLRSPTDGEAGRLAEGLERARASASAQVAWIADRVRA